MVESDGHLNPASRIHIRHDSDFGVCGDLWSQYDVIML